jgi:hypothetical protein
MSSNVSIVGTGKTSIDTTTFRRNQICGTRIFHHGRTQELAAYGHFIPPHYDICSVSRDCHGEVFEFNIVRIISALYLNVYFAPSQESASSKLAEHTIKVFYCMG